MCGPDLLERGWTGLRLYALRRLKACRHLRAGWVKTGFIRAYFVRPHNSQNCEIELSSVRRFLQYIRTRNLTGLDCEVFTIGPRTPVQSPCRLQLNASELGNSQLLYNGRLFLLNVNRVLRCQVTSIDPVFEAVIA